MARSKKPADPILQPNPLDRVMGDVVARWDEMSEAERMEAAAQINALLTDEDAQALLELRASLLPTQDTAEGFIAFFKLMTGFDLHHEAQVWARNIYKARKMNRGYLLKAFRESAKSTLSKFYAAFRVGHSPQKVGGMIRINDNKAQEKAAAVAYLIEFDPRWKLVFPHVIPDKARGWGAETGYYVRDGRLSDQEWATLCDGRPDGPSFVGRGWKNGSNIGSHFNNFLDVDDILDENNTSSFKELQAVTKFYTDTLSKTVMEGCYEMWEFTPWLENDTYAYANSTGTYYLSESPVMRPASPEAEGASFWPLTPLNPDYPEAGNIPLSGRWWYLTWPEVFHFERIAKEYRTAGAVGFARMMLLDLEAAKGITLKAEWLHEYPAADIKASWPVVFGVDYASTTDKIKQKGRDNFSLAIKRAIPGGGLVLVDGYLGKLSKGEALALVASYAAMYPTLKLIGVENIGKGEEFYNDLLLTNDSMGRVLPLVAISHGRTSKGDRFENWLAPRYQTARCWITDTPTPYIVAFRNAWISFPHGVEDDSLDSDYMATHAGEGFLPATAKRTPNTPTLNPQPKKNAYSMAFGRN